jgi:galactokinase
MGKSGTSTPRYAGDAPIPVIHTLEDIYSKGNLVKEGERWDRLRSQFENQFGQKAHFIARAPGRVNLMGDHVDHMKFSCMPAALEMDILMAVHVRRGDAKSTASKSTSGSRVMFNVCNTTERFTATSFESDLENPDSIQLHHEGSTRWANYFKVAYKGLIPHLPARVLTSSSRPVQIDVLVDGTIPPESSLSSSAAMTSCSSIVILEAFQARDLIGRSEMAEVAIESERLVGVNSGGMDQAASIFGVRGSALYISFDPVLKAVPTSLPRGSKPHTLVIANTLVVSDKKVMGPVQYNLRVCELLIACRTLCEKLGLPKDNSTKLLKPLTDAYFKKFPLQVDELSDEVKEVYDTLGAEAAHLAQMRKVALDVLPSHAVTRQEAEKLSGYEACAFDQEFLKQFPVRAETFALAKRVQHVFDESLHVLEFRSVCDKSSAHHNSSNSSSSDATLQPCKAYAQLGSVFRRSQKSLFDVYENACPELRQMCELLESNGALGARPTGAGWGGSVVSLVEQSKVESMMKALRTQYYDAKYDDMTDDKFANSVLVSQPAQGACIYTI